MPRKATDQIYIKDGIAYTKSNYRMRYNPEYHENYFQPYSDEDKEYMCAMWDSMKKQDIALALGRTHGSVLTMAHYLRKMNRFEYYKKRGQI